MESLIKNRFHIIIVFKQGENIDSLKAAALEQIIDKKYYAEPTGKILCIGIAHNTKTINYKSLVAAKDFCMIYYIKRQVMADERI